MNLKFLAAISMAATISTVSQAQTPQGAKAPEEKTTAVNDGSDFTIEKDETIDGVRYVTAVPSKIVCSVRIDIQLKGEVIDSVAYTKGCNGNAKGIGALIKGMTVDEAISRLKGITCGKRPTSCPDQLAKVLEKL